MDQNFEYSSGCKLCLFGSKVFGHGLTRILGKKWQRIKLKSVTVYLQDLNLQVVGGLTNKGYTDHDIDVVGEKADVVVLVQRLDKAGIHNLVHYCGKNSSKHSHFTALINGFLIIFFGNKIY